MKGYAYPQKWKTPKRGETVLYSYIAGDFSSYPAATAVKANEVRALVLTAG